MRGGKSYLQVTSEDLAPYATPWATYFQTLSAAVDNVRERSINLQISKMLKTYDRVLVVYGSAHLMKSRPVYEQWFGRGRDSKPAL